MNYSTSSYVDEAFYRTKMDEDTTELSFKSYPVKVVALRMEWILKDPAGKKFLIGILKSENLDLYSIPAIQIIIEFLFHKYKIALKKFRLRFYYF